MEDTDRVHGLVTRTQTRVLKPSTDSQVVDWAVSTIFYNDEGHPISTRSTDHMGAVDEVYQVHGYGDGRVHVRLRKHWAKGRSTSSSPTLVERDSLVYDVAGRVVERYQTLDNDPEVLLEELVYNAIGQLAERNVDSYDGGSTFTQSVDFKYHPRGWLEMINKDDLYNPEEAASGSNTAGRGDLFGMRFIREDGITSTIPSGTYTPRYDGSIRAIYWKTAGDIMESDPSKGAVNAFAYHYDPLGRLKRTEFEQAWQWNWTNTNMRGVYYNYDLNGNLTYTSRYKPNSSGTGSVGFDQLYYYFDAARPNRLTAVRDNRADSEGGFLDGSTGNNTTTEYTYNENGALTSDANKGITNVDYSYISLPNRVEFSGNDRIEYTYLATGARVRKRVFDNNVLSETTDYAGGGDLVYIDYLNFASSPHHIATDYGRSVRQSTSSPRWINEYTISDHLGTARVRFKRNGSTAQILDKTSTYPYGMRIGGSLASTTGPEEERGFHGKRLDDEFGLDWHHYGWRYYDSQIGRWISNDPADEFHSPYSYVGSNPINLVDPDGRQAFPTAKSLGEDLWDKAIGNPIRRAYQASEPIRGTFEAVSKKVYVTGSLGRQSGNPILRPLDLLSENAGFTLSREGLMGNVGFDIMESYGLSGESGQSASIAVGLASGNVEGYSMFVTLGAKNIGVEVAIPFTIATDENGITYPVFHADQLQGALVLSSARSWAGGGMVSTGGGEARAQAAQDMVNGFLERVRSSSAGDLLDALSHILPNDDVNVVTDN